jgi:NAD/NADP transhydrogenase alpha subunit
MLPPRRPWPKAPVYGFDASVEAMRSGDTVVEVAAKTAGAVEWVEVAWLER